MLAMGQRWRPGFARLGQEGLDWVEVLVVDVNGRPVSGWRIKGIQDDVDSESGKPVSLLVHPTEPTEIEVSHGEFRFRTVIPANFDGTFTVQIPLCWQPFLTWPEVIALLGGGAALAAGLYWKIPVIPTLGEVAIGASIFTLIYRHSCL